MNAVKVIKVARRVDRWAGRLVGAPSDLKWSDNSAGLYAVGLGIRIVAAGLIVVLASLLLMSVVAFAPPITVIAGLCFGALLMLAGHIIYPAWTDGVGFHVAFIAFMGTLPLVLVSGAAAGLSPADLGAEIVTCFGLGFGFLWAFAVIEQITAMILMAFEPVPYVWGSKRWMRHNVRLIRRAQRRAARSAARA